MRRVAYPYGRYMLKGKKVSDVGHRLKGYVEKLGFSVVRFDPENEGIGTLILAVNKKVGELFKQKKPPGPLFIVLGELMSAFEMDMPSYRDMDAESQRTGIELYLWPLKDGTLMELFVLPYMDYLDKPEKLHITQSEEEEITDWYLCEQIWEEIEPKIAAEFGAVPVHRRA